MSHEYSVHEGMIGAVQAFEGIADAQTIIHGPTGCKFYPSAVMEDGRENMGDATERRNALLLGTSYYFGQPRVPCTYLDMQVFVNGARDRLEDLVRKVSDVKPGLIGVMNSPGASLIGEDLSGLRSSAPIVTVDGGKFSHTEAEGFQDTVLAVLQELPPVKKAHSGVNLMGISINHLRWYDTVADIRGLLEMCGIRVNRCIGAGWSAQDIPESADSELNILIYPEYGDRVAGYYRDEHGIPFYECPEGALMGFYALERMLSDVCGILGKDPSPALDLIRSKRASAARILQDMERRNALPRGRTFSVMAGGSLAHQTVRFLYNYLGMIPVQVRCTGGEAWEKKLQEFLDEHGIPVTDDPEHTYADLIIAAGPVCAVTVSEGFALGEYTVEWPSARSVSIDPLPPIGLGGTVRMLDTVLDTVLHNQHFH